MNRDQRRYITLMEQIDFGTLSENSFYCAICSVSSKGRPLERTTEEQMMIHFENSDNHEGEIPERCVNYFSTDELIHLVLQVQKRSKASGEAFRKFLCNAFLTKDYGAEDFLLDTEPGRKETW